MSNQRKLTAEEIKYIVKSGALPASAVRKLLRAKPWNQIELEVEYSNQPGETRGCKLVATVLPLEPPPKPRPPGITIQREDGAGCVLPVLLLIVLAVGAWACLTV